MTAALVSMLNKCHEKNMDKVDVFHLSFPDLQLR
jgi:hypothetical protein